MQWSLPWRRPCLRSYAGADPVVLTSTQQPAAERAAAAYACQQHATPNPAEHLGPQDSGFNAKHLQPRPVQRRRDADVRVVPQPCQVQLLGVDGRAVVCNRRV
jgi:hypothetical protein